ncbi:MAG: 23S rRNA (pseudouridine(1915)-N(3))-methyltransferase RlmH [Proteobacteria bacterium]|nr:23S rRNA (pseudouridine(1915)-N(3))-methyltransferase RlmH [Pseudomonadota bacterium]MBI3499515.1 23S rRNA (pseudouridine(1915)-N(3))-methyltransferase RlmH [Pseudomonadota bacterium]
MRIHICAVGRAGAGPHRDLYELYVGRLGWQVSLHEVVEKRPGPGLAEREAERLTAAVPRGAATVALDERGRSLSSAAFAERLGKWRDESETEIAFLIGGADGLAPRLRAEARLVLALGPMTWPHLLVRGLLAEQLYRAQQILAGHPYHRG